MIYEVQGNDQQGWIVEAVGSEGERYASRPFKDAATAANCAHFAEEITRSDFKAMQAQLDRIEAMLKAVQTKLGMAQIVHADEMRAGWAGTGLLEVLREEAAER